LYASEVANAIVSNGFNPPSRGRNGWQQVFPEYPSGQSGPLLREKGRAPGAGNMTESMSSFAMTPKPPYFAVIFTSRRTPEDRDYGETANRMEELAQRMPGYLGLESARGPDGLGITVSYWASEEAIANWKRHAEHRAAQDRGKHEWYEHYELRVAKVERAYSGPEGR
jgi:heme-degrading monooxygenase HmoA